MNISKIKTYKDLQKFCLKKNERSNQSCISGNCEIFQLCGDYNNAKLTKEQFLEKINIQARKEKLEKLLYK